MQTVGRWARSVASAMFWICGPAAVAQPAQPEPCAAPQVMSCAKFPPVAQRVRISTPGTLSCDAGSAACRNIEVTVYPKGVDRPACEAVFPYGRLEISKAQPDKVVSWKLKIINGAVGFGFAKTDGIQLAVPASMSASAPPSDPNAWQSPKTSRDGQTVTLKIKDAIAATWCHYPRVANQDGETCCPRDPVISNDPS